MYITCNKIIAALLTCIFSFCLQICQLPHWFSQATPMWKWGSGVLSSSIQITWIEPRATLLLMSEDSDLKPFHFPVLEDEDEAPGCSSMARGASGCSSMSQLHRMGGYSQGGPDLGLPSEGSDSSGHDPSASPHNHRKNARSRSLREEDVEMKSSGSSGSGTESHGNESHGNESHGNESHGHESTGSSNGNSKDSALLESSESNKRSVVAPGMMKLITKPILFSGMFTVIASVTEQEESGELLFLSAHCAGILFLYLVAFSLVITPSLVKINHTVDSIFSRYNSPDLLSLHSLSRQQKWHLLIQPHSHEVITQAV